MIKKIIQTIFSKGIVSILNFIIVMLTAKYTGAVGRGEISLMYLNITLVLMFNDLIGGSALVYLIPKLGAKKTVLPSFIVALCSGILLPLLINIFHHYSSSQLIWFILLSLSLNLSSISNVFLNGLNKIKFTNLFTVIQTILIFLSLCFFIFYCHQNSSTSYFAALLIGFIVNFLLSFIVLYPHLFPIIKTPVLKTIKEILSYGFIVQAGNLIQLLNYRISYYLLDVFYPEKGKFMVGVFSTGSSVAESAWVIMNGISMVQYAAIANNDPLDKKNSLISIQLAKLCLLLTSLFITIILVLPNSIFIYFFGSDFTEMQEVIKILSPGIIIMGFTGIYSHYFAGIGLMKVSTFASLTALIVSIVTGLILIPLNGLYGAALSTVLSYFTSSIYLIINFRNKTNCSLKEQFFDFKNVFTKTTKL
jgi:O-antigen/teichoic acid export membrane protein